MTIIIKDGYICPFEGQGQCHVQLKTKEQFEFLQWPLNHHLCIPMVILVLLADAVEKRMC